MLTSMSTRAKELEYAASRVSAILGVLVVEP